MVKNFIFLGAPGVGKGTIAHRVMAEKGIIHISTGTIFRDHIKRQTPLGQSVAKILAAGKYVPDDIVNKIVALRLQENDVKTHGFILDGYPRTTNQAHFLETIIKKANLVVVLLEVDPNIILKRLAKRAREENRLDDDKQVVQDRIEIYIEKTAPLINYYDRKHQLVRINAKGSISANVASFYKRCMLDHD